MPLEVGHKLGPYVIVSPIGKGGMGEVYRARDTKLEREVAIKVLPDHLAENEERVARFEREAKLLASLNHPNIAGIYGFESNALVLELVEGPTLAERIENGPIPIDEAIAIAEQIAAALESGHEAGIIHRDLKPANVKLREDGTVKVLDYGLAKALEDDAPSGGDSELSQSPTLTRQGTQMGVILGTAAYMSPEQAKGKRVDRRADVWAFGAVVYEMLTGKRAFAGEDVSETLAYVLTKEPDWNALPSTTPTGIRQALRVCLTKDLMKRIRDVGDARLAMLGTFETDPGDDEASPLVGWRPSVAMAATAALGLSIVTGVTASRLSAPVATPPPVVRTSVSLAGATLTGTNQRILAFSPDGSRVVYTANDRLYVRSMDQTEATPLRGTEGAESPFFAPDSDWVGFWSNGQLQKITIRGGAPVSLCDADVLFGARWGSDDSIVFGQRGVGIFRVSAGGGEPELLVAVKDGEQTVYGPQILPGGRAVLFTLGDMGDWDNAGIVVQSLESGKRKVLIERGRDARYLSIGHLVYALDEALYAVPFDVDALEVSGSALPVVDGVRTAGTASGATHFSVSDTGSLIYLPGSELRRTLVWVDRNGREESIAAEPRGYAYPRISPDGSRVVLDVRDQENDLWIWELARETLTRLTFDPAPDLYPVWTPDARRVAFASSRNGEADLYWKAADGTGSAEQLSEGGIGALPYTFTPDGRRLVYRQAPTTATDLMMFSLDGTIEPLLASEFAERNAEFSPDGRWVAYQSNASGRFEIYVRQFPNVSDGQWLISRDGGERPLWAPDGRELFYLAPGSRLMSVSVDVDVDAAGGFAFGNAEELFRGYFTGYDGRTYDITPDGERFLMIQDDADAADELILVQNWFSELERLASIEP